MASDNGLPTAEELAQEIWADARLRAIEGRDRMDPVKQIAAIAQWLTMQADVMHADNAGKLVGQVADLHAEISRLNKAKHNLLQCIEGLEARRKKLRAMPLPTNQKFRRAMHADVRE